MSDDKPILTTVVVGACAIAVVLMGTMVACVSKADAAERRHGTHRTRTSVHHTRYKPRAQGLETGKIPKTTAQVDSEIQKLTPDVIRAYVARQIAKGSYVE